VEKSMHATAQAQPNIALVKYWGKQDVALNLPAVGSLSITLDRPHTRTTVEFDGALSQDRFTLNGRQEGQMGERVSLCLDRLRQLAGSDLKARVSSENDFPTGAGLASSASGFAALVVAADAALGLGLTTQQMADLARTGSGSAARSLLGGIVELELAGQSASTPVHCLRTPGEWPLAVAIAITSQAAKATGSTEGMERSRLTSPYYSAWVEGAEQDLARARDAVARRDFEQLADVSEYSCLKMHALALSAQPGMLYWNGASVECMHALRALRASGVPVFFTVDAGPQVKAVCMPESLDKVSSTLQQVKGVSQVMECSLGTGARLVGD
jgi:diphosphomevalonate decarboxylase